MEKQPACVFLVFFFSILSFRCESDTSTLRHASVVTTKDLDSAELPAECRNCPPCSECTVRKCYFLAWKLNMCTREPMRKEKLNKQHKKGNLYHLTSRPAPGCLRAAVWGLSHDAWTSIKATTTKTGIFDRSDEIRNHFVRRLNLKIFQGNK